MIIARNPPPLASIAVQNCSRSSLHSTPRENPGAGSLRAHFQRCRQPFGRRTPYAAVERARVRPTLKREQPRSEGLTREDPQRARRPARPATRTSSFLCQSHPCSHHNHPEQEATPTGRKQGFRGVMPHQRSGQFPALDAAMPALALCILSTVRCNPDASGRAIQWLTGRPPREPAHDSAAWRR